MTMAPYTRFGIRGLAWLSDRVKDLPGFLQARDPLRGNERRRKKWVRIWKPESWRP